LRKRKISRFFFLDIIVQIQPSDVLVSLGDETEFSCNFTGQHRVRREKVTWLKGNLSTKKTKLSLRVLI
jgi:hypothetical protein